MTWQRSADALAEVLLTLQRILLPWVEASKLTARSYMNELEEKKRKKEAPDKDLQQDTDTIYDISEVKSDDRR